MTKKEQRTANQQPVNSAAMVFGVYLFAQSQ